MKRRAGMAMLAAFLVGVAASADGPNPAPVDRVNSENMIISYLRKGKNPRVSKVNLEALADRKIRVNLTFVEEEEGQKDRPLRSFVLESTDDRKIGLVFDGGDKPADKSDRLTQVRANSITFDFDGSGQPQRVRGSGNVEVKTGSKAISGDPKEAIPPKPDKN